MKEIEFKLRFLLNSITLKALEIKDISDSKRVLEFNAVNCDSRKLQAFCAGIGETTFFPMFGVPLTPHSKIHTVIFCEIAVGNSLFVSKEYSKTLDPPKGFDSFIVEENDTLGFLSDKDISISKFSYAIKDQKKIIPLFEVVFEYDAEFEAISRNSDVCHKCKKNPSFMFCPSERANFCKQCDMQVHCDDFLKRHRRIYFSDVGQKKFICCSYHSGRVIEYFCETCMEPICTECKMTGKHSAREFFDHSIISFLDACQLFKGKITSEHKSFTAARGVCNKELDRFKDKIAAFKENIGSTRKEIEREFKNLMLQLDNIENGQRQIINAKYLDRVCKCERLERIEAFSADLDPADLLTQYKNISDTQKTESAVVFDKIEFDKVEVQGKMAIKTPKNTNLRIPSSDSKDKAIKWRIETLHISERDQA